MSRQDRMGFIGFFIVIALVALIVVVVQYIRRPPTNAAYIWDVRGDVPELQRRVDRTWLSENDISWLIEQDHLNINHALIDCSVRSMYLTVEHLEQFFGNNNWALSERGGQFRVDVLTNTGHNFAYAMNRIGMSERHLLILANNAVRGRRGDGLTGLNARLMLLMSYDITPEPFRILMAGWENNYNTVNLNCANTRILFGYAFARKMRSSEFLEFPLINERDYMQSQYGRILYAIESYSTVWSNGRRREEPELIRAMHALIGEWLRNNRSNLNQVSGVVEWYERRGGILH